MYVLRRHAGGAVVRSLKAKREAMAAQLAELDAMLFVGPKQEEPAEA